MALVKGLFVDKDIPIQSNNDPVDPKDLARKGYVDQKAADEAAAAAAEKVSKAGDTMTGPLMVESEGFRAILQSNALIASQLDEEGNPIASAVVSTGGINLSDALGSTAIAPSSISLLDAEGLPAVPTQDENVATKKYVDQQVAGIDLSAKADLVDGKVPSSQLPGYVDDVEEYADLGSFPVEGSAGKLYVAQDTNKVYRWSGSVYIEISASPGSTDAVPEGAVNKYFTDERAQAALASALSGKANLAHQHLAADIIDFSSAASAAAPVQSVAGKTGAVSLVKGDVGLGSVDNTSDADKPISTATATALAGKVSKAGDTMTGELILQSGLTTLNPINGFNSSGEQTLILAPEDAAFRLRRGNFETFATPNYVYVAKFDPETSEYFKTSTFIFDGQIYLYDENLNAALPVDPAQVTTKAYVDAAIGALPGGLSGKKEVFTLSATDIANGYVDCAHLAAADTMLLMSGGVVHQEVESYLLSEVGGVTRITFTGDLIAPSETQLLEGEKVYIQYLK